MSAVDVMDPRWSTMVRPIYDQVAADVETVPQSGFFIEAAAYDAVQKTVRLPCGPPGPSGAFYVALLGKGTGDVRYLFHVDEGWAAQDTGGRPCLVTGRTGKLQVLLWPTMYTSIKNPQGLVPRYRRQSCVLRASDTLEDSSGSSDADAPVPDDMPPLWTDGEPVTKCMAHMLSDLSALMAKVDAPAATGTSPVQVHVRAMLEWPQIFGRTLRQDWLSTHGHELVHAVRQRLSVPSVRHATALHMRLVALLAPDYIPDAERTMDDMAWLQVHVLLQDGGCPIQPLVSSRQGILVSRDDYARFVLPVKCAYLDGSATAVSEDVDLPIPHLSVRLSAQVESYLAQRQNLERVRAAARPADVPLAFERQETRQHVTDVEDLVQHLPPCMATLRNRAYGLLPSQGEGVPTHLQYNERLAWSGACVTLGMDVAEEIVHLAEPPGADKNGSLLQTARTDIGSFKSNPGKFHPPGCRSIRTNCKSLCPFQQNSHCLAAAGLQGHGAPLAFPADFVHRSVASAVGNA